jgi:hypothetical protein
MELVAFKNSPFSFSSFFDFFAKKIHSNKNENFFVASLFHTAAEDGIRQCQKRTI